MIPIPLFIWHFSGGPVVKTLPFHCNQGTATNKTSGGDRIPVELIQILEDDAVKVLPSICQQIWKTQQWLQD